MKHHIGRTFLPALVILLLIPALAMAQKTVDEIIVRVNGDIILKSELENARTTLRNELAQGQRLQGVQLEQAFTEQSKFLLRDLIDQTLLVQQAKDAGINADLEIVKTMERMRQEYKFETLEALEKAIVEQGISVDDYKQQIRNRYLTSQVLGREVYPKIIITNEEMRKYYDANQKNFDRPAGIQLSEITISTDAKTPEEVAAQRKKAEDALAALKNGDDFAETARKFSEAPTAQDGGVLGFFPAGQLAKALEDAVSKLDKGQITEILTLPYGFVILKVDDKHSGGILSYELAQKEIQDQLFQQQVTPKIREFLTRLRTEGFIEIKPGYVDAGAPPEKAAKVSEAAPDKK
jgi:peptidyl-prolyl cis-trans isomerase SurA